MRAASTATLARSTSAAVVAPASSSATRSRWDASAALPTAGGYELQLEVRLVTVDDRGRSSLPMVWPFTLGAAKAPADGDRALYTFDAILGQDTEQLVVTIHDRLGEAVFLTTTTLGGDLEGST